MRFLLLFCLLPLHIYAQTDNLTTTNGWDSLDQILAWRSDLVAAVRTQNTHDMQRLTDLLRDANTTTTAALPWDERWPLYLLTERYSILLDEVKRHTPAVHAAEMAATLPPKDSLFPLLDQWLYQHWLEGENDVAFTLLKEEDRQFVPILTAYLLRTNPPEEIARRGEFLKRYPASLYRRFIESNMQLPIPPRKRFLGLNALLIHQQYRSELERHFNPTVGFGFDFLYHKKHFFAGYAIMFSEQKIALTIPTAPYTWNKGDAYGLSAWSLYTGYRAAPINRAVFAPFVEVGRANLYYNADATSPDEDDKVQLLDYNAWFWGLGLVTDLKLRPRHQSDGQVNPWAYHGVRLKLGWRPLQFGRLEPEFEGNAFYMGIGYQLML
jgi:hypothetical protein